MVRTVYLKRLICTPPETFLVEVSSLYLKFVIQIQSLEIHWARTFSNKNCYWDWCKVHSGIDAHDCTMMEILHAEVN